MSNGRRTLICTCGWTYREPPPLLRSTPDVFGFAGLNADLGLAVVLAGHKLLDVFQPGRHKVQVVRDVQVDAAMRGSVRSAEGLTWALTKRTERMKAQRYLDDLVAGAWARYGWERPS